MRREKRKINKFKVGIIVFIFLIFLLTTSGLGRFVYNTIRDQYLTSKQFYFTSDLLSSNGETYVYQNWDGKGIYNFDVELFSKINDLQKLDGDQEYTIMVTFPEDLNCAINTTEFEEPELYNEKGELLEDKDVKPITQPISATSTIYKTENNIDEVTIYVKALTEKRTFSQGKELPIVVTAYTSSPYKKSLKATFKIKISTSYTIEDDYYEKYGILTIRNTSNLTQYIKVTLNSGVILDMTDREYVSYWSYSNGNSYKRKSRCSYF